jgi:hypothetical protein
MMVMVGKVAQYSRIVKVRTYDVQNTGTLLSRVESTRNFQL